MGPRERDTETMGLPCPKDRKDRRSGSVYMCRVRCDVSAKEEASPDDEQCECVCECV